MITIFHPLMTRVFNRTGCHAYFNDVCWMMLTGIAQLSLIQISSVLDGWFFQDIFILGENSWMFLCKVGTYCRLSLISGISTCPPTFTLTVTPFPSLAFITFDDISCSGLVRQRVTILFFFLAILMSQQHYQYKLHSFHGITYAYLDANSWKLLWGWFFSMRAFAGTQKLGYVRG